MKKGNSVLKHIAGIGIAIFVLTAGLLFTRYLSVYLDRVPGLETKIAMAKNRSDDSGASSPIAGRPSFVHIVKQENPAVVNISSTKKSKHHSMDQLKNPFKNEDPFWEFFKRFRGDIPEHDIPMQSLGSGFIISKDGYILTNNHVIEKADTIKVTISSGQEYDARIVGTDPKTDIGLIKIDSDDNLPVARLGDSDRLEVGEWVIAIGNPFRLGHTVTAGIVSAKGRMIGQGPYDDFIQTDASINPGNSGGPLINSKGEVVGINSAIYTAGMGGGSIGIGFAIPINMAKNILSDLKEKGAVTRGWLGVMIQKVTPEIAKTFHLKTDDGALIGDVIKESPAEEGGVKRGDVIIKFGDTDIKTFEDLPKVVASTKPETVNPVVLIRDGKEITLEIKIGILKDKESYAATEKSEERIGLTVQNITPEIAQRFTLKSLQGVIISKVGRGPGFQAGLRRGQVIIEINRQEVGDIADYNTIISSIKDGDTVIMLVIEGDGGSRYVGFTISKP